MQMLSRLLGVALVAMALVLTCSRDALIDPADDDTGAGKTAVVAADVSECGGFQAARAKTMAEPAAETLEWAYDAATSTLDLMHSGLSLNCCGIHVVDADFANGVVTIYENDQPEPDGGRCRCICGFDFRVALTGIPDGTTGIRIMLTIDDTTVEHWAGAIDLGGGSGAVVIGESAGTP